MAKAVLFVPIDGVGGAERVVAMVAAELAARGWDVSVVACAERSEIAFLDRVHDKVQVFYGRRPYGLFSEWEALGRIAGQAYDLAFSTHFRINLALSCARRAGLLKTRRLVTRESTVLSDRAAGARLATYRVLYGLYGAQDEIWAQTRYMADRLAEMIGARLRPKVRVMPNPIDVSGVRRAAAGELPPSLVRPFAERPHIAWCGRLIPIKNPRLAVEAFAEARRLSGLDLGLVMMGGGPELEAVQALAAGMGLQDRTLLLGSLANPHPVFAAARLGLLTSVREGFPNVLLEMMAAGVPHIVTTACAGDLDSLTGVEIVPAASAEALGQALARAAAANSDRRALYGPALALRTPQHFVDQLIGPL